MMLTTKNAVFWDVTSCSSFPQNVLRLQVTANAPRSPILVTLMMEEIHSSETSVLIRTTWHNIPEYNTLHFMHLFALIIHSTHPNILLHVSTYLQNLGLTEHKNWLEQNLPNGWQK
jgi:hypothetical protein